MASFAEAVWQKRYAKGEAEGKSKEEVLAAAEATLRHRNLTRDRMYRDFRERITNHIADGYKTVIYNMKISYSSDPNARDTHYFRSLSEVERLGKYLEQVTDGYVVCSSLYVKGAHAYDLKCNLREEIPIPRLQSSDTKVYESKESPSKCCC